MTRLRSLTFAALALVLSGSACAQPYPSRPIRLIVPSAAGGNPDINSRTMANELSRQLGQQVVVENRPGASGIIGLEALARATPDGYTIGQGLAPALAILRSLQAKLPYDPDRDFQMVAQMYFTPNLLAVTAALPVRSACAQPQIQTT